MIVVGDNPLMFAPDRARTEQALAALDALIVIDSVLTDTAKAAHAVLADVPSYGKTGTFSNAERRVNRLHAALDALGDARPALLALIDLANAIGGPGTFSYAHPDAVTDEIAANVPGYERFAASFPHFGRARVTGVAAGAVTRAETQAVASPAGRGADAATLLLTTGRTLYTSLEGAELHSADADKLHREEFAEIHPADAAALRISDGEEVQLASERGTLAIRCKISGRVQEGFVFVPAYFDAGAVTALLAPDGAPIAVRIAVAETA
jgi:predicted molibdopterin-dependent oxidoreductase YjgC